MNQKNTVLLIIVLLITSCYYQPIMSESSLPKDADLIMEVPANMWGNYLQVKDSWIAEDGTQVVTLHEADTIQVPGHIVIGDTVELKKMDEYYFFNSYDKEYGLWGVMPFTYNNGTLIIYELNLENEIIMNKIKSITQVNKIIEIIDGEKNVYHLINPSNRELREILEKDLLSECITYYKIR